MPALKTRKLAVGLAVTATAAVVAVLVCEGAYSIWTGDSLLRAPLGVAAARRAVRSDADRIAAAGLTRGPFALATDPHVGIVMKPEHTHAFLGVDANTDAFGQRVRLGDASSEDATRIVVLGDSVAFGLGVADTETYAHVLEKLLAAALDPSTPPAVVTTVACPGWNTRNATRYLRNHLDRIDPDIVLYIPVRNDLADNSTVDETGQRASVADPLAETFLPHVSNEGYLDLYLALADRTPLTRVAQVVQLGSASAVDHVLRTGYTPESRRRWDAFARDLAELDAALATRAARLAVVMSWDEDFQRLAERRLAAACPRVPPVFLFRDRRAEDGLDNDPHPNPRCIRAGARRVARWLLEQEWLPRASASPLPALDADYASRTAEPYRPEQREKWHERHIETVGKLLGPEIDLSDATGFHQVYGGLAGDGTVGRSLFVALRNTIGPGVRSLAIELVCLDLESRYPLDVTVSFRGSESDAWTSSSAALSRPETDAAVVLEVPVPEEVRSEPCLDIAIHPRDWAAEQVEGRTRLASFRLRKLRLR